MPPKKEGAPTSLTAIWRNMLSLVGGPSANKLDAYVDNVYDRVGTGNKTATRNVAIDAIRQAMSSGDAGKDIENAVNMSTQTDPNLYDTTRRGYRYREYDAMVGCVSHVKRALTVLADNIVSPDNITKRALEVSSVSSNVGNDDLVARIDAMKDTLKIDKAAYNIVLSTLSRGDHFVEIVVSSRGEMSSVVLTEGDIGRVAKEDVASKKTAGKVIGTYEFNVHPPKRPARAVAEDEGFIDVDVVPEGEEPAPKF